WKDKEPPADCEAGRGWVGVWKLKVNDVAAGAQTERRAVTGRARLAARAPRPLLFRDQGAARPIPHPWLLLLLPRVPEPLVICGRLLPALVGRAGADQVHVGAEVLAVLARAVAGAVGTQAEVLGRQLLRCIAQLREQVAALILDAPLDGV